MSIHYWSGGSSYPVEGGVVYADGSAHTISGKDYWAYGGSNYKVGILPFNVSSGGVDSNTSTYDNPVSGYQLTVRSDGVAENVSVHPQGSLVVSSGGSASIEFSPWNGPITSSSGAVVTYNEPFGARVYVGNASDGVTWSGFVFSGGVASHNSACAYAGGVIDSATVYWQVHTHSGAVCKNTRFRGYDASIHASSGSITSNCTVEDNGGHLTFYSGASASHISGWGGAIITVSGATADHISCTAGGDFTMYGGNVTNFYGEWGCSAGICGGRVTSVTMSGGHMDISWGAVLDYVTIWSGGHLHVESNASALRVLVVGSGTVDGDGHIEYRSS